MGNSSGELGKRLDEQLEGEDADVLKTACCLEEATGKLLTDWPGDWGGDALESSLSFLLLDALLMNFSDAHIESNHASCSPGHR